MPDGMTVTQQSSGHPRVWLMMGNKAGDNSQVMALAEATGWPFEIKRFVFKPYELVTNLLLGANLHGLVKSESSPLEAPWPDLMITGGRRNEPICLWVQKQARKEGKNVRIVHVGRSWAKIERFDLIVTTPQYRLPVRPNVLHNKTPLHRVTNERLQADAEAWAPRLDHLPKPHIAVVVGGSSGPYSFDKRAAERLGKQASKLAAETGGSLLITTSARTPADTIDTLEQNITAPTYFYRWQKGAADNPYFAFLGLADSIVVTGDSMSMLAEACATRKRVHIFDLGEGRNAMRPMTREETIRDEPRGPFWEHWELKHIRAWIFRMAMHLGPDRMTRDIRIVHKHLVDSGRAVWLGDSFPPGLPLRSLECVPRAAARVRAMFEPARVRSPKPVTLVPAPAEEEEWRRTG